MMFLPRQTSYASKKKRAYVDMQQVRYVELLTVTFALPFLQHQLQGIYHSTDKIDSNFESTVD